MPKKDGQDGQTFDWTRKSAWWSVTCYNTEGKSQNIDRIEDLSTWPDHVKCVYGGREVCPDTGRLHFQAAVHANYDRASKIRDWLPGAHIEVARNAGDLEVYAMKSDTAVGEKKALANPTYVPYYSADMLALLMAKQIMHDHDKWFLEYRDPKVFKDVIWQNAFVRTLGFNDKLFGQMMNPSFKSAWLLSLMHWLRKARLEDQKDPEVVPLEVSEPVSITRLAD